MAKAAQSKKPETSTEETTALATNENETEVLDPKVEKEKQLKNCEKIIHAKTDAFLDVVVQLAIIKEENLYKLKVGKDNKPLYKTFESYIDAEFGFKRAYYSRLNAAYAAYQQLKEALPQNEMKQLPKYPTFYIALSEIKEEKRIDAINEVVKKKAGTNKRMKGSDITRWGKANEVLKKEKNNMPRGITKKVQIFTGLVKDIAKLESIAEDIKSLKKYDENTQQTLINNLQKILKNLK